MPACKLIPAILDKHAAHKHPKIRAWLTRHPRWTFHFTPTSCSWLNAVETFFAPLTRRRLQRGAFHSPVDLQAAINRYLDEHNQRPKPFVWTADPDRIIAKCQPWAPNVGVKPLALAPEQAPAPVLTEANPPHPMLSNLLVDRALFLPA